MPPGISFAIGLRASVAIGLHSQYLRSQLQPEGVFNGQFRSGVAGINRLKKQRLQANWPVDILARGRGLKIGLEPVQKQATSIVLVTWCDYVGNHTCDREFILMKLLDLIVILFYYYQYAGNATFLLHPPKPLRNSETMKTAIRFIALTIVLAGAAAASITPSHARNFASHQAATASNPIPLCAPGLPNCPKEAAIR